MRITERGQLTIPKALRDRYGITPSTELAVLPTDEGLLIVKSVGVSPFAKQVGKATAPKLPRRTDEFLSIVRDGDAGRRR